MKNKFVFYIFLALVCLSLLTPLVDSKALLYPFVTSKAFYFRILVELALPFYFYLIFSKPNLRPNLKQPLTLAVLVFFVLNIASAVFGVNMLRSFLGNFERMGGVYYMTHLVLLYFYVLLIAAWDGKLLQRFLQGMVWASVLVSLNGISGKIGGPMLAPDSALPARVSSTLGNPIFLASFLILPLALALFFSLQTEKRGQKIFYGASAALILIGIYLSGTRGAVVGLAVGVFSGIILFLFTGAKKNARKIAGIILATVAVLAVLLVMFNSRLPQGSVLRRLTEFNDSNTKARLLEWRVALKGAKERPIFGVGSENYYIIANKYYQPEQNKYDGSWFDKPHNYILEILDTNGGLGLLSYLAVLVLGFWALILSYRAQMLSALETAVLAGGWVAYQVQNLFAFDTVSASLTMYVFAAFASFLAASAREEKPQGAKSNSLQNSTAAWAIFGLLSLGVLYLVYVSNILPMRQATNINYGFTAQTKINPPNFVKSKEFFDRAVGMDFNYDTTELFFKYSDMALQAAQSSDVVSQDFVQKSLADAISAGETASRLNPTNPVDWYFLAALRYFQAVVNHQDVPQLAVDNLDQAMRLAPTRPEVYYLAIQFAVTRQDLDKALALAEEYNRLYPELSKSVWELAFVNYRLGKAEIAAQYAQAALSMGYKLETLKEAQILIDFYRAKKDYAKVVQLYEDATVYDANNEQVYLGLIQAYADNGQLAEARALAREVVKADPSQAQALKQWLQ